MSANDVSTAEIAQSDQYLPANAATQQYYQHHYKQQQQQQCVLHIPLQQQQQQQPSQKQHNNSSIYLQYNSSNEMDDYYWKNPSPACNNIISSSNNNSGKTYITPIDIPPPPPHPPNISGNKRFQFGHQHQHNQQQQKQHTQQRTRCQCEHTSLDIIQAPLPPLPAAALQQQQQHSNHIQMLPQQQQQQQQQQQYHLHNYPAHDHHLPPREEQQSQQYHHQHYHPAKNYQQRNTNHHQLQAYTKTNNNNNNNNASGIKNLVYSKAKIRRIRIILGIVGALVILGLLALALVFIITGDDDDISNDSNGSGNGIYLDDVLSGKLVARRFNGSWSTGTNVIFKEHNSIVEYDVTTKKKNTLLYDEPQQYVSFEKSADGLLLLLAKNYKKNFRYSFEAEYDIYNISSRQIQPLNLKGEQRFIISAQWAPVGNGLVINFERNLYYKPTAFAEEIAITSDDNPAVLNGIPDWVYEEEVLFSNSAVWFNPAGTRISFIRFDDTPTHVINIPYYGEAADLRYQYPYTRLVAYPKAGSSNPRVSLFTADLVRAAQGLDYLTNIPVPSELNTETDYIITVVEWLDNDKVLSVWMNRIQNLAYLQVFGGLKRYGIYSMESKTGWVDLYAAPFKNRDGTRIALILPQLQDKESGYYRHLCLISTVATTKNSVAVLTKGKYVVQAILHWDTTNDLIFYTANTEEHSEILHVYAVKASDGKTAKCLTCKLHTSGAVEQTYYSASFNHDHQVVISSLGPGIPMHSIYDWTYTGGQVNLVKLLDWENNAALRAKLSKKEMPTVEIHEIPIEEGFTAKALLLMPPNLDRSGKTKYPMLVDVYGGPDSYSVVDKWMLDWGTYLASNHSVIYAKIDGRGSGLRGDKLLHSVYLKLGTVEIDDQVQVARELRNRLTFIDANRTGIWGWSYGGYAAAMALANQADNGKAFKCAASIAPVTDWAYYDSIYTERYMSLPKLNEAGYENSRLSTRAQKLRDKKFLLVHGTLDDNVHYQQAMILAKNLERNDILFKQISYPDEDHGLAGVRPHLYHSLDRFFGDCFGNKRMMESKK